MSIDPADGASQVTDETITITFSEPVDRGSVQAVFSGATFDWNNQGTSVAVTTELPFADTPQAHTITLPSTVVDLAGNGLAEPYSATIVLAALHTVTLNYQSANSGYQLRDDDNYAFVRAGDHNGDQLVYGGVSFNLGSLPGHETILLIRRATMKTQVIYTIGNPNAPGLNGFLMDRVTYSGRSILDATVLESGFATLLTPGSLVVGEPVSVDVTPQLDASWSAGDALFQVRIYPGASNDNQIADLVYFRRMADERDSIVASGVMDPDADNRMRLEIEYFD